MKENANDIENRILLGKTLKNLRDSKNLSIRELAELCKFSKSTIVNIEQGHFSPRIEIVQKILNALGAKLTIELNNK